MVTYLSILSGAPLLPTDEEGWGDEDWGVSADEHADRHNQREVFGGGAAKKVDGQEHQNNSQWSVDRADNRFVQTSADNFFKTLAGILFQIFPNPVKNDDRVVDGQTKNRQ